MNANELADELEDDYWDSRANKIMLEGAKMLRQQQAEYYSLLVTHDKLYAKVVEQQAEIEAFKLQLHTTLTNRDLRTYDGKTEINNEPLAWALIKAQEK